MARPSSASNASRLATSTTLIPDAAICRANSLPIPDEAPVTSAQGPNRSLSTAALMFCSLLTNSRIDAAGCLDDLPCDPPSVGRGEERDHIGNIRRRSEPPQRRARNHSLHRLLAHPGGGCPQHCCIHQAGGHRVYRNAPGTEFRRPNASQRIVIACHKVPIQSLSLFASITTPSRSWVPSAPAAIP